MKIPPSKPAGRGGFTLLEILLATVIAAVVLIAVQGVFHSAIRLRQRSAESLDASLPVERTLAILRRDLENLAVPGGTLSGALQTTPTNTLASTVQGQVGPQFCTTTGVPDSEFPWADLERVSYLLLAPTNEVPGRVLVRAVTRNLLPGTVEPPVPQEWLMDGVEDLRFEFHDGQMWRSDWDSTVDSPPLPRAIKVVLQQAARERTAPRPQAIELVVANLIDPSTNATTTSTSGTGSGAQGMP